jgi:hypothetical protein
VDSRKGRLDEWQTKGKKCGWHAARRMYVPFGVDLFVRGESKVERELIQCQPIRHTTRRQGEGLSARCMDGTVGY